MGDEISLTLKMEFRGLNEEDALNEHEALKLSRMDALRERVNALLATPLMQIVSHEPVISSNITKTNVLTMNENFSNSLELYEYLLNYDKKPYMVTKTSEIIPLSSNVTFPLLGLELLVSLLKNSKLTDYEAYKNTLDADNKKKAIDELSKRIEKLRDKYQKEPAEYISLLEDKINLLDSEVASLDDLKNNLNELIVEKISLEKDNKSLRKDIDKLLSKLNDLEERLKDVNASEDLIRSEYEDKLKEKNKEIEELKNNLSKVSDDLSKTTVDKQNLESKVVKLKENLASERDNKDEIIRLHSLEIESKDKEIAALLEYKRLNEARFKGIQAMAGELLASKDDTNKEAFDELEMEYNAFTKYFNEVWELTKKEIIKEIKRKKG